MLDNITNLEIGGTWTFKAYITEEKCKLNFKVVDIQGY